MDFRAQELGFIEADRQYDELVRQREEGSISDEEFDEQRQRLMVRDDEGYWWAKVGEAGEWHYRDGGAWVRGIPAIYREVALEPAADSSPGETPSHLRSNGPGSEGSGRRALPLWIPVAGLGGMVLVGIVVVAWVLVPFLWSAFVPGEQVEPTASGVTFDAAFVHRATPDNISANSTYLDNPLTNDNPDAVVYVTQNWNPGGDAGTYNNHPVGVWYDPSVQQWAIFNQDIEPMPEGSAFNVAILEESAEAAL